MRPDEDGAIIAMEHVGEWVRYADAKAGLVAAAAAGLLALAAGQSSDLANAMPELAAPGRSVVWVLIVVTAALGIATFWCVFEAVVPRPFGRKVAANRFAWPALAQMSLDEIRSHAADADLRPDAWAQAKVLADIASMKYRKCRAAIVLLVFLMGTTVLLVVVTGVVTTAAT